MFRIHVVNSVKGGCGKSTFSLFLADYLSKKKMNNVIIDLDTCGSSWFLGNKPFLEKNDKCCFLTDLILDYKGNITRDHVFKIKTGEDDDHPGSIIHVVMSDFQKAGVIDEEEVDLFESAVLQLIKQFQSITDFEYLKGQEILESDEPVADIILDMPPGYEVHSERILKHLLMDLNSELYSEYHDKDDSRSEYSSSDNKGYKVYLYMLSGVDQAKLRPNIQYVENLFNDLTYSTDISVLNPDKVYYIINNVNAVKVPNPETLIDNIKSSYFHATDTKVFYIPHIDFIFSDEKVLELMGRKTEKSYLTIRLTDEAEEFSRIFDEIFPETLKKKD